MTASVVTRIVNHAGRSFNVRLVCKGDRYGLDNRLVHDKNDPLVEFWDATYEHDPRFTLGLGQFVSRYYLATLTDDDGTGHELRAVHHGIALCGHEPVWTISGSNLTAAIAAVTAALAQKASQKVPS